MNAMSVSQFAIIAALSAGAAIAAPVTDSTQQCVVSNMGEYQQRFIEGPNNCAVRPESGKIMLSRFYTNNDWNSVNNLVPIGSKPFVFASGATTDDSDSCVQKFLQAGSGNTRGQWDTMLDIGYTTEAMCGYEALANNSTLLVWEADVSDDAVVLATWDNVVPYMAKMFQVQAPAVTAQLMKETPYQVFASAVTSDGNYATLKSNYGKGYCTNTYTNPAVVQDAMADPTGVKFRAVLEACFSFFDVFMGTGYTYDSHTGAPGVCREYLYPARNIQKILTASLSFTDDSAQQQQQQQVEPSLLGDAPAIQTMQRRDAPDTSLLAGAASEEVFNPGTVTVLPLTMAIGKTYIDEEGCTRPSLA